MEGEYSIQYLCLAFAVIFACILGLLIHSFIIAVNITDWMKGRPITTIDQILLYTLGSQEWYINYVTSCSLWLSTLLAVVFCLKISNFHNVLFVRVKTFVLHKVVSHYFLSTLFSILCCNRVWSKHILNSDLPFDSLKNASYNNPVSVAQSVYYMLGNILPFLFNCVSAITVLVSLCLNMTRVKSSGTLTTHLDTHCIAIKAIISCFISFSLQVFIYIYTMSRFFLIDALSFYVILHFFPAVHSIYLISITDKLRNQFF
ncbi:hypothetical protein GDO78_014031 [Eleutherodactylus coqui]|uniref:Taste receptor type 2 member 40 n=1 Tax=Eleutherodactylus coqui TaxID=57060 RepID=A0A8J6JQK5_ELECQ|nr:hypothetical protein GDO78_014031 [Eleutherodactylus coqui]